MLRVERRPQQLNHRPMPFSQEKVRKEWKKYLKGIEAIIFVVDSSDKLRIAVAREELSNMLHDIKEMRIEEHRGGDDVIMEEVSDDGVKEVRSEHALKRVFPASCPGSSMDLAVFT